MNVQKNNDANRTPNQARSRDGHSDRPIPPDPHAEPQEGDVLRCKCGTLVRLKQGGRSLKRFNAGPPFALHECPRPRKVLGPMKPKSRPPILVFQAPVKSSPYKR